MSVLTIFATMFLAGCAAAGAGQQQSFEVILLNPHGGDMNGFFLIRGESADLSAVMSSEEWNVHMTRAAMHLDGVGAVRGATGDMVMARMAIWGDAIPE